MWVKVSTKRVQPPWLNNFHKSYKKIVNEQRVEAAKFFEDQYILTEDGVDFEVNVILNFPKCLRISRFLFL